MGARPGARANAGRRHGGRIGHPGHDLDGRLGAAPECAGARLLRAARRRLPARAPPGPGARLRRAGGLLPLVGHGSSQVGRSQEMTRLAARPRRHTAATLPNAATAPTPYSAPLTSAPATWAVFSPSWYMPCVRPWAPAGARRLISAVRAGMPAAVSPPSATPMKTRNGTLAMNGYVAASSPWVARVSRPAHRWPSRSDSPAARPANRTIGSA